MNISNRRLLVSLMCFVFLLSDSVIAYAASTDRPQQATKANRQMYAVPAVPFGFELGKTTAGEAELRWREMNARELRRGSAAVGKGSHLDDKTSYGTGKILLVDIGDTEWEVVRNARFAFYDGILYAIHVALREPAPTGWESVAQFDEQDIKDLETQLRKKYGSPKRAFRDHFSGAMVRIWEFGDNHLILSSIRSHRSSLSFVNSTMQKQVEQHKKEACETRIGCR